MTGRREVRPSKSRRYPDLEFSRCACGAVEVCHPQERWVNHMRPATFLRRYRGATVPRRARYGSCDHCVNHWGIDICQCGSGEPVGKCPNGYPGCRRREASEAEGQKTDRSMFT